MATFWWIMTILALVWYLVVSLYVGVKGGADIRHMTQNLAKLKDES